MQETLLSVTRRSPAPVKGIDNGRMAIKGPGCCWRPLDYEYRVCMLVCLEV